MSWFFKSWSSNKKNREYPAFWREYLARFDQKIPKNTPIEEVRFVVFDTETTGLNVKEDQILSIGAVEVIGSNIAIQNSFERFVHQSFTPIASNIEIHEILPDSASKSQSEEAAIKDFLEYIGNSVLVGHHVGFDVTIVNQSLQSMGTFKLKNKSLDTGLLAKRVQVPPYPDKYALDDLCDQYGIEQHDRHNAAGDAYLTAILFLKLLGRLRKRGVQTYGELMKGM